MALTKIIEKDPKISTFFCPICGFELDFEPWRGPHHDPSHYNCQSCGIEFGFDDDELACGIPGSREELWKKCQNKWIADGMPWRGNINLKPKDWDPKKQFEKLNKKG